MSNNEMQLFIDNLNEVYQLGLTMGNLNSSEWVNKFQHVDYSLAKTMAALYYSDRKDNKKATPDDVYAMKSLAEKKVTHKTDGKCEYCSGSGQVNVKRYLRHLGYIDFAYACMCSSQVKKLSPISKEMLHDFEQIQKSPARYADVYVWDGSERTSEVVPSDKVKEVKVKQYSTEAIEKFKTRMKLQSIEDDKKRKKYKDSGGV